MGAHGAPGTDKNTKFRSKKRGSASWTIPVSDFEGDASYFKAHKRFNIGVTYAR